MLSRIYNKHSGIYVKKSLTLLFLCAYIPTALAAKAPKPGVSGEFSLVALQSTKSSHLSTKDDKTLASLSDSAATQSAFIAAPLGKVAYTFDYKRLRQLYIGTSRDDIAIGTLAFEIGYRHALESGSVLGLSVLPTILSKEVWQNPYLTGAPRKVSNIEGMAYRIKLNSIVGTGLSLSAAYADSHITKETITDADLTRDAKTYYLRIDYRQPLSRSLLLMPAVDFIDVDATGKAASYKAYKANISAFYLVKPHKFALTLGTTYRKFDQGAATFNNKVRSDNEWRAFLAYEYIQPFDWKDGSLISFLSYNSLNSNIDFYDERHSLIAIGINYQF